MSTDAAKKIASHLFSREDVDGIENLAKAFTRLFYGHAEKDPQTGKLVHNIDGFYDRFPQYNKSNLPETDLDALEHYYGQALSQKKYGTMPTFLAGLFNEVRGTWRGNRAEGTIVDLINNASALAPDFTGEQNKHLSVIDSLLSDPKYKPTNEQLQDLIDHGLKWTADPPKRELY